jgi:hypothetical protein
MAFDYQKSARRLKLIIKMLLLSQFNKLQVKRNLENEEERRG